MKRIVPALAWAWIALVISICAEFAFLAADVGQARQLLDVALGEAARQVLEHEGDGGAVLGLAFFSAFSGASSATSRSTGHVAAVQAEMSSKVNMVHWTSCASEGSCNSR